MMDIRAVNHGRDGSPGMSFGPFDDTDEEQSQTDLSPLNNPTDRLKAKLQEPISPIPEFKIQLNSLHAEPQLTPENMKWLRKRESLSKGRVNIGLAG